MQSARRCACGALLELPQRLSAGRTAIGCAPLALSDLARPRTLHLSSRRPEGSDRSRREHEPARRQLSDFSARPDPWLSGESPFGKPFPATSTEASASEAKAASGSKARSVAPHLGQIVPSAKRKRRRSERRALGSTRPERGAQPDGWAPKAGEIWAKGDSAERQDKTVVQAEDDDHVWLFGTETQLERVRGPFEDTPAPMLTHGLERVLFNPGVHFLRDPRSGVYNFDHRLEDLPWPEDVHLDRLAQFVKPSDDPELLGKAQGARYAGSTSSLTAALTQLHKLLVGPKPLMMDMLSTAFSDESHELGAGATLPASIMLHRRDGVFVIDQDKSWDSVSEALSSNLLSDLGNIGEAFITTEIDEFRQSYVKAEAGAEPVHKPQTFSYAKLGSIVMRSQIDCVHPYLPRKTFDIKTRAVAAIRQDKHNHELASEYRLRTLSGRYESYEREYFDLIRSAFLKNSMQVRIGGMDGIFVAHHDTRRVLGFQYIPLEDMDNAVTGSHEQSAAAFNLSLAALTNVLDRALADHQSAETVSITLEHISGCLSVFVEAEGRLTWHTVYAANQLNGKLIGSATFVDFSKFDAPPTWDVRLRFGRSDDQRRNRAALEQCRARQRRMDTQLAPDSVTPEMLEQFRAAKSKASDAAAMSADEEAATQTGEDATPAADEDDEAQDESPVPSDLEQLVAAAETRVDAAVELSAPGSDTDEAETARQLQLERELGALARQALDSSPASAEIRAQLPPAYMDAAADEVRSLGAAAGSDVGEATRQSFLDAALGRLVRLRNAAELGDDEARKALLEAVPSVPLPALRSARGASQYDFKLQPGVNYRLKPSPLVRQLRSLAERAKREPVPQRGPEVYEVVAASVVARPRANL